MPSFLRGPFGEPPSNIKSPNPTPNPFLWQSIIYIMRYLHCSCYLHFPYRLHLSSSSSPLPIRPLAVSRQSHRFQQSPPSVAFNFHQGAFAVSHLLIPNHALSLARQSFMMTRFFLFRLHAVSTLSCHFSL